MPRQRFTIATRNDAGDDDSLVVMVPRNQKVLVPTSSERVRRLRRHLVASLRALRTMKNPERSASPLRPEPDGFAAHVARTACSLCRGWCCKGGGDHAYLDERTMARVRRARMELDARAVLRLYVDRVPAVGYEGSCVFHSAKGSYGIIDSYGGTIGHRSNEWQGATFFFELPAVNTPEDAAIKTSAV